MGLAAQGQRLAEAGLAPEVINTIQGARALSTRTLYDAKWKVFHKWCSVQSPSVVSTRAPIGEVLRFLQGLLDKGLTYSTIKVYIAAISACHVGYDGKPVGEHPLVPPFRKGVKRATATDKPLFPLWELAVVLEGLCKPPFEPLESADIKALSLKTVLLVALTTTKRVSDIQALSTDKDCMRFSSDGKTVWLKPNLKFVTKNLRVPELPVKLVAFHPPPFLTDEDKRLHSLCPVRALRLYVQRTCSVRSTSQLFVSYKAGGKCAAVCRSSLSRWIVEAIKMAYVGTGAQPPGALRAHSTRGVATSWALARGASVQEICESANWASPSTFVAYYHLDVSASSVAHAVLGVADTA